MVPGSKSYPLGGVAPLRRPRSVTERRNADKAGKRALPPSVPPDQYHCRPCECGTPNQPFLRLLPAMCHLSFDSPPQNGARCHRSFHQEGSGDTVALRPPSKPLHNFRFLTRTPSFVCDRRMEEHFNPLRHRNLRHHNRSAAHILINAQSYYPATIVPSNSAEYHFGSLIEVSDCADPYRMRT